MEYFAQLKEEDGVYLVTFPDFEHVNTYGETREDAIQAAVEALNGVLSVDFERGFVLPRPTPKRGRNAVSIRVDPNIALAYQLRALRKGQTQAAVAARVGISYQAYQKLENPRKCNPTVKTLEKISKAFGKTLEVGFH